MTSMILTLQRFHKQKSAEGHKNNFYRCISEGGLLVSDIFHSCSGHEYLPLDGDCGAAWTENALVHGERSNCQ